MCGLATIFTYSNSVVPLEFGELDSMSDVMYSRGPDMGGVWLSDRGNIGMVHRRLAIIDLSDAGKQPMHDSSNRYVIVFNGEIYNYKELKTKLIQRGSRFNSDTDTEVLLELYKNFGSKMVTMLRGMFSFIIYDKGNDTIFAARDPFGIKPLYFSDDGNCIRFASQVKALLECNISQDFEPAGHVGFYLLGSVPEPYTLYKSIRALPPGNSMTVTRNGVRKVSGFFVLSEFIKDQFEKEAECKDLNGIIKKSMLDSLQHHLISDVNVGFFLSSGKDSSVLAALAKEIGYNVNAITLGFEEYKGTSSDETVLASEIARQYNMPHSIYWVEKKDFIDEREKLFKAMDQPSIDGINTYFVSKVAAEAGLKVSISGLGGDEFLGGYPGFSQIPSLVNNIKKFKFLGSFFRKISSPLVGKITSPKYSSIFEYGSDIHKAYFLRRGLFMPWELYKIFDKEFVDEGLNELRIFDKMAETIQGVQDPFWEISVLEASWYMRNQLLRDTDWASMAHSLEVRVPLIDLEWLKSLIRYSKTNKKFGKDDFALLPNIRLPEDILHRKKTGFSIPVREWMMGDKNNHQKERGLRGWADHVYKIHTGCGEVF